MTRPRGKRVSSSETVVSFMRRRALAPPGQEKALVVPVSRVVANGLRMVAQHAAQSALARLLSVDASDLGLANFGGKTSFLRVLAAVLAYHGGQSSSSSSETTVGLKRLKSMVARLASCDTEVARTLVWQASHVFSSCCEELSTQVGLATAHAVKVKNVGPADINASRSACWPPPSTRSAPVVKRGAVVEVHDRTVVQRRMPDGTAKHIFFYLVEQDTDPGWPRRCGSRLHPLAGGERTLEVERPGAGPMADTCAR